MCPIMANIAIYNYIQDKSSSIMLPYLGLWIKTSLANIATHQKNGK